MASITGAGGCVKIAGGSTVIVGIKEWSLDYSVDIFDITEMAASAPTHKSQLSGLKGATGSFSGNVTDGATGVLGALTLGSSYDLHLETDGTDLYDIPVAIVTGLSTSVAVGGEAIVTCNFISSGSVAFTNT